MKTLTLILTLILSQQVSACFDDEQVQALIDASKKLNRCFVDGNDCNYENRDLEQQRKINARRLVPVDRSKSPLLNLGTGQVELDLKTVDANGNEQRFGATAERISSCHIVTSAHLLYESLDVSTERTAFDLKYKPGQTCDKTRPYANSASAELVFKMTDARQGDFSIEKSDDGEPLRRVFSPNSDLVILKLKNRDDFANKFFSLNTMDPSQRPSKLRVNCWGYPGHNEFLGLSKEKSDMYLWHQTGALISNEDTGKGILTNSISYKGMSGGGCSTSEKPDELVGLFSSGNRTRVHSAIAMDANKTAVQGGNRLSGFHVLAKRFAKENSGRTLKSLEDDCN